MNKAIDLQENGKLEEAASIYLKILDIQPSNAAAMHLLGLVFHSQGKFKHAVECIGKAIIESPDVADFHSNMAASQLALGLAKSASRHAKKAVQIDFNMGEAHYNLGNALFSLGKSNDAISSFGIFSVVIAHRTGSVCPGENIVCIHVGSAHREEGFSACSWLISELKKQAPLWKKEIREDGEHWKSGLG